MTDTGAPRRSLLVVAGSADEREMWLSVHASAVRSVDSVHALANDGFKLGGLANLGNAFLSLLSPDDIFGMIHADTIIPDFEPFFAEAERGSVTGMVGRDLSDRYRWSKECDDVTLVSTLDCCSVFFRIDGLRFDQETFTHAHCFVEDLCLTAAERGKSVTVPKARGSHLGASLFLGNDQAAWSAGYAVERHKLGLKWSHVKFNTT